MALGLVMDFELTENQHVTERAAPAELLVPFQGEPMAPRYADNQAASSALPPLTIDGLAGTSTASVGASNEAVSREVAQPTNLGMAPQSLSEQTINQAILQNAETLVSGINRSNNFGEHAVRAVAESTLRVLSIGLWGGTGISQHHIWQRDVAARNMAINPPSEGTNVRLTPQNWANCFTDVQTRRDQLGRAWGNCAEQAASLAHIVHSMINNPDDRSLAGLQVRQAYGVGHSWVEVQHPTGQVTVYDPWARRTGRLEDMPASYRETVRHTPWFGRTR